MSWIYSQSDYFGIVDDNYLQYEAARRALRGPIFNSSLNAFKNSKILVAGCGFGGLVEELMNNWGFTDVWGCDASSYAINRNTYPSISSRLIQANCLVRNDLNNVKQAAGLSGNQRFRIIITEDLLPCMSNRQEVATCLTELRRIGQTVGHIISVWDSSERSYTYRHLDGSIRYTNGDIVMRMPGFLWLTQEEWRTEIGSSEWIFKSSGEQVA